MIEHKAMLWNLKYLVGTLVYVDWADGGFYARTAYPARIDINGEACIKLVGKAGYWLLSGIQPADDRTE